MCGLILASAKYTEDQLKSAMRAMGYRGADGNEGLTEGFGWKLGHVRLAIQDLSDAAAQPFISKRGMTAFVGELFNHAGEGERHYLEQLLVTEDFHEVDGFWAIVNVTAQGVRVFTDHLSIKPLYWWPEHNIICSEIAPMFALERPPALDEIYLANCIKFGYDHTGRTPYEGIRQLPVGARLFLSNDGEESSFRSHWQWKMVDGSVSELRQTIDWAIMNRLVGDRPVALLLSGGLDSSIVYYSLREHGIKVQAFSVENGEDEYLPEEVQLMPLDPVSMREAVRIMQAPLDLGSLIPQIQLARAVRAQGYHVAMTGDGADELFGGYRRAKDYDSQKSDVFCELPYYHLPRLDRVMMRSTVELRSPFLSPRVVATAFKLPRHWRTEKQALKEAYRDIVPKRIIERPKHPLKTQAVITGGQEYRQKLVEEFRKIASTLLVENQA